MPIYEYACQSCGKQIEVIQQMSDRPLKTCEGCGGRLEKLLSRSAFVLKGGGWYADGYGKGKSGRGGSAPEPSKDAKAESKAESKTESESKSKSESSPDSKPKAEAKPSASKPKSSGKGTRD